MYSPDISSTSTVKGSDAGKVATHFRKDGRISLDPPYRQVTFGTLPDDVLLEIFDFYVVEAEDVDGWHTLVHVCRRWRNVVFSAPRRLELRLLCTDKTPVAEMLDLWPALPIVISDGDVPSSPEGTDNIIAAFKRHGRVREIVLGNASGSLLRKLAAVTQEPFPELTLLDLESDDESVPVLPESFLGSFAPRLRTLHMEGIPFPHLRKLLLSANGVVELRLSNIPHSGYISPETMVTCLSSLSRLGFFELEFRSPQSRPNSARRRPPPLTRTILPALTSFWFRGVSEYLEDFVGRIDTPLLYDFKIYFFHQLVFDHSQLPQFINRAEQFKALSQIDIVISRRVIEATLSLPTGTAGRARLTLGISCSESDWQASSLEQVCRSSLPLLSNLERLDIREHRHFSPQWQDDMDNSQWLELLRPFIAVKDLYLSEGLALRVAPALQELVEESATDLLPALQSLFLEGLQSSGSVQEAIGQFVAVRQLSENPVIIQNWERG
ncbi:hypothetical protein BC827DRAFT_1383141 [Russula dissimulans]|nr:hypothetical protein BC827DRAFT_1383141 [Russula dissimulans]